MFNTENRFYRNFVSRITVRNDTMGRVNYGTDLYDRKGISKVTLANQVVMDYTVYSIPLDNLERLKFTAAQGKTVTGPVFLKGSFKAGKGDCFVNMDGFTKGYVFVNGFNLGRYWSIGPQKALYIPGSLLKEENEIIVFETENCKTDSVKIQAEPGLG